jgi:hypothetical protein
MKGRMRRASKLLRTVSPFFSIGVRQRFVKSFSSGCEFPS